MQAIKVGDVVVANFIERGKPCQIRAHVVAVNDKRGKAELNWVRYTMGRGGFSMAQKRKWVALGDMRVVHRDPGELAPNDEMRSAINAMAGKDVL
jgi:hypothetical protein